MEITYTCVGDFLLPDITLSDPPQEVVEPLGRYARMRRAYLKAHRTAFYNALLLSEGLFPHLREIDATASERRACGVSEEIILSELVCD